MNFTTIAAEAFPPWDIWSPVTWCVGLWLAFLGGCFGSFLNVVIYRVPAGKSVVHPGSHCPVCGHAIRWYDNIPLISWLVLRARCRDCHTPIPIRYPFVEVLVAAVFLGLAAVAVLRGGAHLPNIGGTQRSFEMLAGIYAYHLVLLVTLVAAVFICYDGFTVPWKVVLPAMIAGLAAPVIWPWLHPFPAWPGWDHQTIEWGWLAGLGNSVAGAAAGFLVALLAFPLGISRSREAPLRGRWRSIALTSTLTGLYLGWSAVIGIGAVTSVAYLLLTVTAVRLGALERIPWTGLLFVTALVWIVVWSPVFERITYAQWNTMDVAVYLGVVILCASVLTHTLSPRPKSPADA
jgi:leader peptidase (prepilin peptidase)/N-methyltransferase